MPRPSLFSRPAVTHFRMRPDSSTAPGVVSPSVPDSISPSTPTTPSVPTATEGPLAARMWRMSSEQVVFPFVPVTAVRWS